jgi:RHH-type transcriptional regulator, proline utilization regulon repressor / proline dehydrogenase / delta 1-pyrroline-5-carboxylate dehydrogenase
MDRAALESGILKRGREFFAAAAGDAPAIFRKEGWIGTVLDRAMRHEEFKTRLFRFVDVLPSLASDESLMRHLREYFEAAEEELIAAGDRDPAAAGKGREYPFAAGIRRNFEILARQFVIGENIDQTLETMKDLRRQGLGFTTDILGEAAVSEKEARRNQNHYLALLAALAEAQAEWDSLPPSGSELDWGCAPRLNISIKPTSLYSQAGPASFEHSVQRIHERFVPLVGRAAAIGAFVCIDMEQYAFKDITLEVYRRLRTTDGLRDHHHVGVVLQSYLKDTDRDLAGLLAWARRERVLISVRLVKGAYWDYERIVAEQNGWEAPVYQRKSESDAAWERQACEILKNHDICHFACATHNVRSIAAACEMAAVLKVPDDRYEFQVLYGMAGPISRALQKAVGRVRLYSPYGEMLPGMAYLVRRLLENTASESFLRRRFADELEVEKLLENPEHALACQAEGDAASWRAPEEPICLPGISAFRNEPAADFTRISVRSGFLKAIAEVRRQLGESRPLLINNRQVTTGVELESLNPANPSEIVGRVAVAGRGEIAAAISGARAAAPAWSGLPAKERAAFLFRAGQILRDRTHSLAAWQILEVGKQWDQSWADVTEAIDFMEYYGREMIRLAHGRHVASRAGEENRYFYRPKGLTAVIAPWNFPMAISAGMCAAALVAGNCVLYKPSSLSAVCGSLLATVFLDAGLPAGVLQFLPFRGGEMGDFLVDHPEVHVIAFTGSMEVGRRMMERAAKVRPGQKHLKKVIAEMGGKNAIIIDEDADLDQAVPHVLASAFGYQGQKCSACSRVIVLEAVYERFVARLVEAARSVQVGPAEDPASLMGPLVDAGQQEKVLSYMKLAADEGELLFSGPVPDAEGYYVPMTIVGGVRPESRIAREEIFGPVLAVLPASSFGEALELANAVHYGLTGGIFSRSPGHVEKAVRAFEVGNLYINRGITGALVGRQPFGGLRLSGIGSKAGGPDYLLQFLDPVSVCENTMRRGFAP